MNEHQGFTILELIVAIGIAAVLATIAIPSFNNLIADSKLTSTTNNLVGALNLARSEAVEAGAQVIVEPDGSDGYQLRNLATNEIIRSFAAPATDITISTSGGAGVTYQANGYRAFGSPVFTIEVCNDEGNARQITVSTGGGVSVVEASC